MLFFVTLANNIRDLCTTVNRRKPELVAPGKHKAGAIFYSLDIFRVLHIFTIADVEMPDVQVAQFGKSIDIILAHLFGNRAGCRDYFNTTFRTIE